jgi:hypothetical protein
MGGGYGQPQGGGGGGGGGTSWQTKYDPATSHPYYYNTVTQGASTPPEAPELQLAQWVWHLELSESGWRIPVLQNPRGPNRRNYRRPPPTANRRRKLPPRTASNSKHSFRRRRRRCETSPCG